MAVRKASKAYCAHNLVVMVINTLHTLYPDISNESLLSEFSQSKTYSLLYDFNTRLWAEGPDYILGLYAQEKGIKLEILED